MSIVSDLVFHAPPRVQTSQPVIEMMGVSVEYVVPVERIRTFKEYAIRSLQRRIERNHFTALRDVSLTVNAGETLGIVGANGAGKSTLLKVLSRVIRPSAGRVIVRGVIAPLLQLGAGFHPELTGRENVYLNGTLLGRTERELAADFEEIVEFAEIGDFIDAPIRTYSTGMVARLGFAVATARRPGILLVDEILSVGDVGFQRKCADRIATFQASGSTIIVIGHAAQAIQALCDRAIWLENGRMRADGPSREVIHDYEAAMLGSHGEQAQAPAAERERPARANSA